MLLQPEEVDKYREQAETHREECQTIKFKVHAEELRVRQLEESVRQLTDSRDLYMLEAKTLRVETSAKAIEADQVRSRLIIAEATLEASIRQKESLKQEILAKDKLHEIILATENAQIQIKVAAKVQEELHTDNIRRLQTYICREQQTVQAVLIDSATEPNSIASDNHVTTQTYSYQSEQSSQTCEIPSKEQATEADEVFDVENIDE